MKLSIIFAASGLLLTPLSATEEAPNTSTDPIAVEATTESSQIPEPNSLLFAGIGGLVLLMCAVRRK